MKARFSFFSRKNYNRLCIIFSVASLFAGGLIYTLFRPVEALFLNWSHPFGLSYLLRQIRYQTFHFSIHLPNWVVYSLPNGFWAFAYALLITSIWSGSISRLKYVWMTSIPFLVYGYEILQHFGMIPGTFCFLDLVLASAGLLAGILLGLMIKPVSHEKVYE